VRINSKKFSTPTNRFSPQPFLPVSSDYLPLALSQGVFGMSVPLIYTAYAPAFQYGTLTLTYP
jgi:hypothetical protein